MWSLSLSSSLDGQQKKSLNIFFLKSFFISFFSCWMNEWMETHIVFGEHREKERIPFIRYGCFFSRVSILSRFYIYVFVESCSILGETCFTLCNFFFASFLIDDRLFPLYTLLYLFFLDYLGFKTGKLYYERCIKWEKKEAKSN